MTHQDQTRFFDQPVYQYPREAVISPPLHTALELQAVLDALAPLDRARPVIDIGAGTGRLSIALARAGYSVLAVDRSERSLEVLRAVAAELQLDTIHTSTVLPTRGSYGAVVGADVLHHIDLDDVLSAIRALLEAGDRIVFTEPGGMNPAWYAWFLSTGRLGFERGVVTCNLRTLSRALSRHGFRSAQITGVGVLPRPLFGWSATACRANDRLGSAPGVRWFAYRYLIAASR